MGKSMKKVEENEANDPADKAERKRLRKAMKKELKEKEKKDKKKKDKESSKKRRRDHHHEDDEWTAEEETLQSSSKGGAEEEGSTQKRKKKKSKKDKNNKCVVQQEEGEQQQQEKLPFDHQYILAPMVGASELPFRLLCRKYGTQLAYTPMMSSSRFVQDSTYRQEIFQTNCLDRPLVAHFSANDPDVFANAVRLVQNDCDAVDLNLGCPQRTAYVGHFGSYLLDDGPDRKLICDIIKAGVAATTNKKKKKIPIFVKIRLLSTLQETITLCQQLKDSGVSLIAIHARHRASWERKGPGARDGPALLDQVTEIKRALGGGPDSIPIIANGNVINYDDVLTNAQLTKADGIMSAEGILDNPALFLPRLVQEVVSDEDDDNEEEGKEDDNSKSTITLVDPLLHCPPPPPPLPPPLDRGVSSSTSTAAAAAAAVVGTTTNKDKEEDNNTSKLKKQKRKLLKKLRDIDRIQAIVDKEGGGGGGENAIDEDQRKKLASRQQIEDSMKELLKKEQEQQSEGIGNKEVVPVQQQHPPSLPKKNEITIENTTTTIPLSKLHECANDKIALAQEYLQLAKHYGPTTMRTQIFHVRRMMKDILDNYQLMPDCLSCTTPDDLWKIVLTCRKYRSDPTLFVYDRAKAKAQQEALERKRHEEGKRKAYEARMIRKAKREGAADLDYYLKLGATVPTMATVQNLRKLKDNKKSQLEIWKKNDHTQHCLAYHLESGCQRGRACAFLHVDAVGVDGSGAPGRTTTFEEQEEVAG